MVKIVWTNVAKTVLWPVNVTDLLGSVKEVVNQDGQGPLVIRVNMINNIRQIHST